jgi:small subunit ribosomal protein S2
MQTPSHKELLDAGCHFGHMKRKWNPKMSPYIFMERKGIHVIDLNRTIEGLETAGKVLRQMAKSGKKKSCLLVQKNKHVKLLQKQQKVLVCLT